MTIGMFTCM